MPELTQIPILLKLLDTSQVTQAETTLVALCQSPEAMQYLRHILTDHQTDTTIRQLAASHINRMLVHSASSFPQGFPQTYLLTILVDFALPHSIKMMIISSLRHYSKRSKDFIGQLLTIVEKILTSIHSLSKNEQLQTKQESLVGALVSDFARLFSVEFKYEADLVNGCETIIIIGQVILGLIIKQKDDEEEKQYEDEDEQVIKEGKDQLQPADYKTEVLRYIKLCEGLHFFIFNQTNLRQFPQIFEKLFKLYDTFTLQNVDKHIADQCMKEMAKWQHFSTIFHTIYSITKSNDNNLSYIGPWSKEHEYLEYLKYQASIFHSKLIIYLIKKECYKQVDHMLNGCIESIKATVVKYDAMLAQFQVNVFIENLIQLLSSYYLSQETINIAQMIGDFHNIIYPLLTKKIAADRCQIFMQNPAKMYQNLSIIVEDYYEVEGVLAVLSDIVRIFVEESPDFFLFIFQTVRYTFEKKLNCGNSNDWDPPEYIINSEPIDLCTAFYLMSIIGYSNELSKHIFVYLRQIITHQFLQKLDYLQIALFYLFLESVWLDLYDNNSNDGMLLLNYIFKQSINPSSKYFLYEFIHNLSDYFIDPKYILTYACRLPQLHNYSTKWKNIAKWITYLESFDEQFIIQLVMVIKGHIRNEIKLSKEKMIDERQANYEDLNKYITILVKIGQDYKFLKGKEKLQILLLEQFRYLQDPMIQDLQDSLYPLLANLLPFFQSYQVILIQILGHLFERHQHMRQQSNTKFYYVLAQYIYYTNNRDILWNIFQFIDRASDSIQIILKIDQKIGDVFMVDIANIFILFQNLLIRHLKQLSMNIITRIVKKAYFYEEFILKNIDQILQKAEAWTIYARCINIELAIYYLAEQTRVNYYRYCKETLRNIFIGYDGKFLMEMLKQLNFIAPPASRAIIIEVVKNILDVVDVEIEEDDEIDRKMRLKRLAQLPSRMTPVLNLAKTIFQEIKNFMIFYQRDWRKLFAYTKGLEPSIVSSFKQQYEKCMKKERKQTGDTQMKNEYIMMMNEEKSVYLKRRRQDVEDEDDEEYDDEAECPVKRKIMYETFTKRLKRDADLLPKDESQEKGPACIGNDVSEKKEEESHEQLPKPQDVITFQNNDCEIDEAMNLLIQKYFQSKSKQLNPNIHNNEENIQNNESVDHHGQEDNQKPQLPSLPQNQEE